ncbi:universal stress protein [Caballeronia sordidicola]|uniref:universal stress protein n=1 Tax=Caballeronia sordidicola TaxID=196367 RepID=UPI0027953A90|nr:universal stress protein [Caballeronia sordidicola]
MASGWKRRWPTPITPTTTSPIRSKREAQSWHADLLVMGTHGRRGVVRCVLGSVANRVAGIARTPLLLVRQKDVS